MCFVNEGFNRSAPSKAPLDPSIIDAEYRELRGQPALPAPDKGKPMTNFREDNAAFIREMKQLQVRHKLRLILMSRRYFFQFGSREAARRVTQELFDLAFAPGELDVLAKVK